MTETADHPLPPCANDNANPLHQAGPGLMYLCRLRRRLVAKDKTGYSPGQWRRYHEALRQTDEVIRLYLAYL
jgi:hypothetical protein